jgi:hypothetical protein
MSEFSKAQKAASDIELSTAAPVTLKTLMTQRKIIFETLLPASRKYQKKVLVIDPVTDLPILGPAMVEKVKAFAIQVECISTRNEALIAAASNDNEDGELQIALAGPVQVELPPSLTSKIMSLNAKFDNSENNPIKQLAVSSSSSGVAGDLIDLSERAEFLRNQRREQIAENRFQLASLLQRLRQVPVGPAACRDILSRMQLVHTQAEVREVSKVMKSLLESIRNHPDNEKLRTLRPSNPTLRVRNISLLYFFLDFNLFHSLNTPSL